MNRGLYGKLAVNNIKHNRQFYLPYLLTGMLTVAFFYTMLYLNHNPGLDELPFGAVDVELVLGLGAVIIGFFLCDIPVLHQQLYYETEKKGAWYL